MTVISRIVRRATAALLCAAALITISLRADDPAPRAVSYSAVQDNMTIRVYILEEGEHLNGTIRWDRVNADGVRETRGMGVIQGRREGNRLIFWCLAGDDIFFVVDLDPKTGALNGNGYDGFPDFNGDEVLTYAEVTTYLADTTIKRPRVMGPIPVSFTPFGEALAPRE
jgi:hypothetical protein